LLNWKLKWILACGLGLGVLRFALSACDTDLMLLFGVALHGASFVFVFITAQIFLDQNVDAAWRTRAQALFSFMNGGIGNLIGYLGSGWWFAACTHADGTRWPQFWGGLTVIVFGVLIYFLFAFQSQTNLQPRKK
jgi:MFS family permease